MMHRWLQNILRLGRDRRGVAAVEFAVLAPLLFAMLGASVEIGRMMILYCQFEGMVTGISRHIARYPEYEIRARTFAQPMPAQLFPDGDLKSLSIIVNSLVKKKGDTVMTEVFPGNVLYGTNPEVRWQDYVNASAYGDEEAVIFVGATYKYTSFMPFISAVSLTWHKDVQILPSFRRSYPWNDGQVDDSAYVY